MPKALDLADIKHGRLLAIKRDGSRHGNALWLCQCDCGNKCTIVAYDFKICKVSSCGCLQKEIASLKCTERNKLQGDLNVKHRMGHLPEYMVWVGMRQRCNNSSNDRYLDYGGRGIKVCKQWDDFKQFYSDMGPRPSAGLSIERMNNNGNYEPSNCKWATAKEQANNKRSTLEIHLSRQALQQEQS